MNIKEIKEMIALMNENGLMELEIEKDGMRVKLKKTSTQEGFSGPILVERQNLSIAMREYSMYFEVLTFLTQLAAS